jgi:hypothetical protein
MENNLAILENNLAILWKQLWHIMKELRNHGRSNLKEFVVNFNNVKKQLSYIMKTT